MLIEPAADDFDEGIQGRLGVRSVGCQFEPGAARRAEHQQFEKTPAARLAAVAGDPHLGPELPGQPHELYGGT